MANRAFSLSTLAVCGAVLVACGGSNSDDNAGPQIQTPPQVNQAQVFTSPLTQNNAISTENYIKNGIYRNSVAGPDTVSNPVPPAAEQGASSDSFSQTNTIEQGVDEADRVKYNGNYMYVAQTAVNYYDPDQKPKIRVLERNNDGSLNALSPIEASGSFDRIEGLYLRDNNLSMLGTNHQYSPFVGGDIAATAPFEQKITVSSFDTSQPSQISTLQNIQIDGALITSRRIDNYLYIVSSYLPYINNLQQGASEDSAKLANFQQISNTPIAQVMPKIEANGQVSVLSEANDCLIPQAATTRDGFAQLVNVTRINLAEPNDIDNICMSLLMDTIYVSTQNMYLLAQSNFDETVLHKIDLAAFEYEATGTVEGNLGWRSNPLFRLSENDGYLRIVTSNYTDSPKHSLHVLKQNGNTLETVASLPNTNQPEPIGKPNEDIYAVRFTDDKAYIVTFERIDPLYVIDLSDNTQPSIEGSLEIPGFSSYIHPLDNGYLLGVGQQVSVADLPVLGQTIEPVLVPDGLKISLFDVSNPSSPQELTSLVIPEAYTPVEYYYKSLSVLNQNGKYQFAMPIEQWGAFEQEQGGAASSSMIASKNSLLMLQTDTQDNVPSLKQINTLSTPINPDIYYYSWEDRSVIHGEQLYYIRGNQVWLGEWSEQDTEIKGPY